jgi:hypothetical protein
MDFPSDIPSVPENDTTSGDNSRKRTRRWLLVLFALAVTVGAFYWLARQNEGFSTDQFLHLLQVADLFLLLGAAVAGLLALLLRSLRWGSLVRPYATNVRTFDILNATLIGFAVVLLLGRPAEVLRPFLISRKIRVPFSSQVGTLILERIYDLLAVLILGGWALMTIDMRSIPDDSAIGIAVRTGGGVILVAAVAAVSVLAVFTFASGFAHDRLSAALQVLPEARRQRAGQLLESFVHAVGVSRQPACFLQVLVYTVAHWAMVGISSWLVFQGFPESQHLGLPHSYRFLSLLALGSAIPVPGLAGAFFVISTLLLTEWLGLTLEVASAVSLAIWCLQLGLCIPLGALAALRDGLNWRKIKNMEKQARL